jgi:hypothetical protein
MATKKEYICRVMAIMDEARMMDSVEFMPGADTSGIDRHIEGGFTDAWRRCIRVMPRIWFKTESFAGQTLHADLPAGTGYVELPDNFYLLASFKMKGWEKAVYEAYVENDRTASIQSSEYTRGSTIRPVCTLSSRRIQTGELRSDPPQPVFEIKPVLNYYSLPKKLPKHETEEALYVPAATPIKDLDNDAELNISDQVMEPLAYLSASTVFTILQKYDISKALEQRVVEMFPGLQSVRGGSITFKQ